MHHFSVKTTERNQFVNITPEVEELVRCHGREARAVLVWVPHTTAGVTINENADPSVPADILGYLAELVPPSAKFRHDEGNSDAHIKSSLVGCSVTIPIHRGTMALGTWQGIFFAEFDGPRVRKVQVDFL